MPDNLGGEHVVSYPPHFRRNLFVAFRLHFGVVQKVAGGDLKGPARDVRNTGTFSGSHVPRVQAIQGLIEVAHQHRFAIRDPHGVGKGIFEPGEEFRRAHLGGLGLQIILQRLENLCIVAGHRSPIAAQTDVQLV